MPIGKFACRNGHRPHRQSSHCPIVPQAIFDSSRTHSVPRCREAASNVHKPAVLFYFIIVVVEAIILRPRKGLAIAGASAFVAIALFGLWNSAPIPFLAIALFWAAVLGIQLHPKASYLSISPQGLMYCHIFHKSPLIPWPEVSNFRVINTQSIRRQVVGFDWAPRVNKLTGRLHTRLFGVSNLLPYSYGMKPEALTIFLNEYRSRQTWSAK